MVQQRFGSSSEKLSVDQINLFDEAELLSDDDASDEEDSENVPAHKRKKKRTSIPEKFPRTEVIHDLSDVEKVCPYDGTALRHFGDKRRNSSIRSHLNERLTAQLSKVYLPLLQ
jgi:transposase